MIFINKLYNIIQHRLYADCSEGENEQGCACKLIWYI